MNNTLQQKEQAITKLHAEQNEKTQQIADLTGEMTSVPSIPLHAAHAIRLYLDQPRPENSDHELMVFLTVCLTSLSRALAA